MDTAHDIREFLATRRAKITPQQAGLPAFGDGNRRVPGLRREEVALLAGVSIDYYARLERGRLAGASEEVLDAVCRALQLDEAERSHLHDLAAAQRQRPPRRAARKAKDTVPASLRRVLDSMTGSPAFIRNGRLDILAINPLGRALYAPLFTSPGRPVNIARFQFLDPTSRDFFPDWNTSVNTTVALLRTEAGRTPGDTELTGLIGELVTRSEEFRTAWAKHNVRLHHTGRKPFRHQAIGEITLDFNAMQLPADPGLTLTAYSAEPGTPEHDGLCLLASWAATNQEQPAHHDDGSERP
ncbi:helix-turn-helix transcriptional regulator [Streptomyces fagopyri]|uniref:helix-turn-helix transcriptional regulator n=1 Tax=Streptomyces fagopyri TaxID=2662397 RepID=UPI0033EBC54A